MKIIVLSIVFVALNLFAGENVLKGSFADKLRQYDKLLIVAPNKGEKALYAKAEKFADELSGGDKDRKSDIFKSAQYVFEKSSFYSQYFIIVLGSQNTNPLTQLYFANDSFSDLRVLPEGAYKLSSTSAHLRLTRNFFVPREFKGEGAMLFVDVENALALQKAQEALLKQSVLSGLLAADLDTVSSAFQQKASNLSSTLSMAERKLLHEKIVLRSRECRFFAWRQVTLQESQQDTVSNAKSVKLVYLQKEKESTQWPKMKGLRTALLYEFTDIDALQKAKLKLKAKTSVLVSGNCLLVLVD